MNLHGFLRQLRHLFRRSRLERDMQAEMQAHLELQAARHVAAGLTADEARFAAQRQFGGVAQIQERARDARGLRWLRDFLQDLRIGQRTLRKERGFALVCLVVLALGIGANTAIFSVVNSVLFRPLPAPEPERIVRVWETNAARNVTAFSASYQNFGDWARASRSWTALGALDERATTLLADGKPEMVRARVSTANILPLFGLEVQRGRAFDANDDRRGAARVAILSDRLWRRRFAADPQVCGRAVTIDGHSYSIIGVLAPDRGFLPEAEIFLPLDPFTSPDRTDHEFEVYGRLRDGVTLAQAQSEMAAIAQEIERTHPEQNAGWNVRLESWRDVVLPPPLRRSLGWIFGAVALVLAIACANFSSLLLMRGVKRSRELAIRAALGGGRSRLIRQLVTESLLIAGGGGVIGVLIAWWSTGLARSLEIVGLPRAQEIALDWRVLVFAGVATGVTGAIAGVLPALSASRLDVQHGLRDGAALAAPRRRRLRNALVVGQLALSIVLLAVSGLLLRSFQKLANTDLGFHPEQVLTARVAPSRDARAVIEEVTARIAALPGVIAAGATNSVPMADYNTSNHVFPVGAAIIPPTESIQCEWRIVSEGYFPALQIPLVRGRTFTRADDSSAPRVVVINQTLARRMFGDADPIGRQINPGGGKTYSTVIGVVGDVRSRDPARPPSPAYFLSAHRNVWGLMTLTIRTSGDPYALIAEVRAVLRAVDPGAPLFFTEKLEAMVDRRLAPPRTTAWLIAAFALLALSLAAAGLYGVMAHSTGQRTREIGIRLALGARYAQVVGPLLRDGLRLIALGCALGLALAVMATQLLRGLLVNATPGDPLPYALAILLLGATALLACWVPARRAAKVDPVIALRAE